MNNSNLITPQNNTSINQSIEETIDINEIEKKIKEPITEPEIIEEVEVVNENNEEKVSEETIESEIKNEVIEVEQQAVDPKAIFKKIRKKIHLTKVKLTSEVKVMLKMKIWTVMNQALTVFHFSLKG